MLFYYLRILFHDWRVAGNNAMEMRGTTVRPHDRVHSAFGRINIPTSEYMFSRWRRRPLQESVVNATWFTIQIHRLVAGPFGTNRYRKGVSEELNWHNSASFFHRKQSRFVVAVAAASCRTIFGPVSDAARDLMMRSLYGMRPTTNRNTHRPIMHEFSGKRQRPHPKNNIYTSSSSSSRIYCVFSFPSKKTTPHKSETQQRIGSRNAGASKRTQRAHAVLSFSGCQFKSSSHAE